MMEILNHFIKNFELYFDLADVKIAYGKQQNTNIVIAKSVENSFWDGKQDVDSHQVVWKEWRNVSIPFLFDKSNIQFTSRQETNSYQ